MRISESIAPYHAALLRSKVDEDHCTIISFKLRAITFSLSLSNSLFNTPNPFPAFSSHGSHVDHTHNISTSKVAIPLRCIKLEGYIFIRKARLGVHLGERTHHIMYFPRILLQFLAVTGLCQAAQYPQPVLQVSTTHPRSWKPSGNADMAERSY